jgi:FAD:protein FMN transferase
VRIAVALVGALVCAVGVDCGAAEVQRARYLMGTICEISVPEYAAPQIAGAFAEGARIEAFLSTWRDDSELSRLNRSGSGNVASELAALLRTAMSWQVRTGGAFNPLVAPLVKAWRTRDAGALPTACVIADAIDRMSPANVSFDPNGAVRLSSGAEFEEGGFGKGYAIDRMLAKIDAASVVINFGGQLGVRGSASVSIADPERRDSPVIAFTMRDASLSTSSGSERTFEVTGRHFSHIFDPRSGEALPARGSASVICGDALTADILSTALYVMGPDEGLRWAEANHVAAIYITRNHTIRMSSEFRRLAHGAEILDRNFEMKE